MSLANQSERVVFYVGMDITYVDKVLDQVDTLFGIQYEDIYDKIKHKVINIKDK